MMLALRNSLTCGPARWTPMSDPNIAVYLDPSLGRTDVAAAVPNMANMAAWAKTRTTNTTATQIVTDAGTSTTYYIADAAQTNTGAAHKATAIVVVTAGTTNTILFVPDTGIQCKLRADGTIDVQTNCTVVYLGAGRFSVTWTVATAGSQWVVYVCANGGGSNSWTSAGGDTVGFSVESFTQPNASALADQTGNGRNILQTVAANRPAVVDASGNPWTSGRARICTDGFNDYLQGAFSLGAPSVVTVLWCGKFAAAYASNTVVWDAKTDSGMQFARSGAGSLFVKAGATYFTTNSCDELNPHAWMVVYNSSGTGYLYRDGILLNSGAIGVLTADGLTVGANGSGLYPTSIYTDEGPHLILRAGNIGLAQRWAKRGRAKYGTP